MVNPALQSAIEVVSLDERLELVEYIESTFESERIDVTDDQKAMLRSRGDDYYEQYDPALPSRFDVRLEGGSSASRCSPSQQPSYSSQTAGFS